MERGKLHHTQPHPRCIKRALPSTQAAALREQREPSPRPRHTAGLATAGFRAHKISPSSSHILTRWSALPLLPRTYTTLTLCMHAKRRYPHNHTTLPTTRATISSTPHPMKSGDIRKLYYHTPIRSLFPPAAISQPQPNLTTRQEQHMAAIPASYHAPALHYRARENHP